jgi:hypothetical protein
MPGSYWSLKYKEFVRNGAHIEGLDSVITQLSLDSLHLEFQSLLVGGEITFHDGKSVTRDHNLIREWFRAPFPGNDEWRTLQGGTADGTNKNGNAYHMQISQDLVEKNSCKASGVFIPVSGTKEVIVTTSKGLKHYLVDYGDGACDNEITITINGKVKPVSVNGDGN